MVFQRNRKSTIAILLSRHQGADIKRVSFKHFQDQEAGTEKEQPPQVEHLAFDIAMAISHSALSHQLKPKPLPSPTLTCTWPKPVFPFKGSKGHLPVEAQPYVFVSRKIAYGKDEKYKLVPEMMYPIEASRQPIPNHEVLEDEYRAFHNVMVNQVILTRRFLAQRNPNMLLDVQKGLPVDSLLLMDRINEVKEQLPELMAYNPGCHQPYGYMYQRFKQAYGKGRVTRVPSTRLTCPPTVLLRGPFQNVVNLNTRNFCEKTNDFDSAVIGRPKNRVIRIYNEPDAISTIALDNDFSQSISARAKRIYAKPKRKLENDP